MRHDRNPLPRLERARERGATKDEMLDTLDSGYSIPAKYGRLGKAKVYSYHDVRRGRYYEQKKVELYYQETNDCTVVITVYVFYGRWE